MTVLFLILRARHLWYLFHQPRYLAVQGGNHVKTSRSYRQWRKRRKLSLTKTLSPSLVLVFVLGRRCLFLFVFSCACSCVWLCFQCLFVFTFVCLVCVPVCTCGCVFGIIVTTSDKWNPWSFVDVALTTIKLVSLAISGLRKWVNGYFMFIYFLNAFSRCPTNQYSCCIHHISTMAVMTELYKALECRGRVS